MERVSILRATTWAALLLAPLALTRTTTGQDVFTLGFEGPDAFSGAAGDPKADNVYYTTLTHVGTGVNAQGWSYGAVAENATITEVTLTGSASEIAYVGGFDSTELVTAAKNPGVASGMVSAVVLHLKKGTTLPANTTSRIACMKVNFVIPPAKGVARLVYRDGLTGSGEPVPIVITVAGDTKTANTLPKDIVLNVAKSCCTAPVVVGFSGTAIKGGAPFQGYLDATTDCLASGGSIVRQRAAGDASTQPIYVAMTSNILPTAPGIQGWSYGVSVDGEIEPASATLTGSFSEIAYVGGFDSTEVIDPAKQVPPGQKGIVSAVVLHLKKGTTLPHPGTESVACFEIRSVAPQGAADQKGTLAFRDGLIGSGEPVPNVITIGGDSATACNFDSANVEVIFRQVVAPVGGRFIRGNVNNDLRLDIADPIWLVNQLFRAGPRTTCQDAADANNDGVLDASDVTYLIEYHFDAGAAPSAPFPACGQDPELDADGLSCEADQAICSGP